MSWEQALPEHEGERDPGTLAEMIAEDMVRFLTVARASCGSIDLEVWIGLPQEERLMLSQVAGLVLRQHAEVERGVRSVAVPPATMKQPTTQRAVLASAGDERMLELLQGLWG